MRPVPRGARNTRPPRKAAHREWQVHDATGRGTGPAPGSPGGCSAGGICCIRADQGAAGLPLVQLGTRESAFILACAAFVGAA